MLSYFITFFTLAVQLPWDPLFPESNLGKEGRSKSGIYLIDRTWVEVQEVSQLTVWGIEVKDGANRFVSFPTRSFTAIEWPDAAVLSNSEVRLQRKFWSEFLANYRLRRLEVMQTLLDENPPPWNHYWTKCTLLLADAFHRRGNREVALSLCRQIEDAIDQERLPVFWKQEVKVMHGLVSDQSNGVTERAWNRFRKRADSSPAFGLIGFLIARRFFDNKDLEGAITAYSHILRRAAISRSEAVLCCAGLGDAYYGLALEKENLHSSDWYLEEASMAYLRVALQTEIPGFQPRALYCASILQHRLGSAESQHRRNRLVAKLVNAHPPGSMDDPWLKERLLSFSQSVPLPIKRRGPLGLLENHLK